MKSGMNARKNMRKPSAQYAESKKETGECTMGGRPTKDSCTRRFVFVLTALVLLVACAGGAFAQDEPRLERMSFADAPVGYILQSLGRMYNVNFSISAGAAAKKVSLEINDASFKEAVNMICSAAGVDVSEVRPGLFVAMTKEESLSGVSEKDREDTRKEERFTNMLIETMSVKYVDVKDVETSISKILGEEAASMVRISKTAGTDDRNYGSLLVTAPNQRLIDAVKKIIGEIDKPLPIVEVSVLFVEITKSKNSSTGIDWDISNTFAFEEDFPGPTNTLFQFGKFRRTGGATFSAAIGALAGDGRSRVLADPKIRVVSGRKANFGSETQVPILSRNSDGDINTDYKNVGITLDLLPAVLEDGTIHMRVEPKASSITGEKKLGDVVAPIISERKATTEVLMRSGETMVIGGLMNDREIRSLSKLPFLSNLPLLGPLFQSEKTENEVSTVVIFIRPVTVEVDSLSRGTPVAVENLFKEEAVPAGIAPSTKRETPAPVRYEREQIAPKLGTPENVTPEQVQKNPVPAPAPTHAPAPAPVHRSRWAGADGTVIDERISNLLNMYGVGGEQVFVPVQGGAYVPAPSPQAYEQKPGPVPAPAPEVWTPPTE